MSFSVTPKQQLSITVGHDRRMRGNVPVTLPGPQLAPIKQEGEFVPYLVQLCTRCWMPLCHHGAEETITQALKRYSNQGHKHIRMPDGSLKELFGAYGAKPNSILTRGLS